ncbi:uncharacterized protein [Pseudochaenichthys georgianus]|uniref:uncharacterized protein isoform X2 n=1 Tax=Pseudochaenichthys georgianus TaxID=52239 RepID=UPI0039C074D6
MLHFPTLHKHITSPAQITDVMTDFIARLKENFGQLDGLALPTEVMGFVRDPFTVAMEGGVSTRAKEVVPSIDEGKCTLKLIDMHSSVTGCPKRSALTGQRSFGVMSTNSSSLRSESSDLCAQYVWINIQMLGFFFTSTWMEKTKELKGKLLLLFIATFIFLLSLNVTTHMTYKAFPKPLSASKMCSLQISEQTLPPLNNTKHILVSAYMDQRVKGLDIRIIGIFKMDSDQPLYSLFCCACQLSNATPTTILKHNEHFGFPFITTDVMCGIPKGFSATHVTLLTQPHSVTIPNQTWLPIRNQKTGREEEQKLQFNFTVCISNLFGDYNNVLQFAQTLEMYRQEYSSLRITSSPSTILSQAGGFTCLSGAMCRELIFWSISTRRIPTGVNTTRTR